MCKWIQGQLEAVLLADGVKPEEIYPLDVDRAFKKLEPLLPNLIFWDAGAQSQQLFRDGEVVMGNIWAANNMLGTRLDTAALEKDTKAIYLQQAEQVAAEITEKYTRCKRVAFTFRFSHAPAHNLYYAFYYNAGRVSISRQYDTNDVVDRVGSGDCFMAGLIHAQLQGQDDQQIISFAAAAAYSKFFVMGDFNTTSAEDIIKLI